MQRSDVGISPTVMNRFGSGVGLKSSSAAGTPLSSPRKIRVAERRQFIFDRKLDRASRELDSFEAYNDDDVGLLLPSGLLGLWPSGEFRRSSHSRNGRQVIANMLWFFGPETPQDLAAHRCINL
jgi:hypothetical protein